MSWHVPRTWVTGEVVRARYFNEDVRDNLRALVGEFAYIDTQEGTTSTTFTDLASPGPAISITTEDVITVFFGGYIFNSTANVFSGMSIEITGFNTASDNWGLFWASGGINRQTQFMRAYQFGGITSGTYPVTAKYRAGANTASFAHRFLLAYAHT